MPDDVAFDWLSVRRRFPAFRILEAASIALTPASVLIATIAGLLLSLAEWLIGPLPVSLPFTSGLNEGWTTRMNLFPEDASGMLGIILKPWMSVVLPVVSMLNNSGGWSTWICALIHLGLAIGLWSIVGTILSRRSAMLFVGNDESTLRSALEYGSRRWFVSTLAPLIPLFSAVILGLTAVCFGMLGRLPLVGELFLTIMSPMIAAIGFVIAFLLVATALGWPLMIGSVATDDCDSFGGLSRAYSELTGRPWQALGFALIGLFSGIVLISIVYVLGIATVCCGISSTALGSGIERADGALLGPITNLVTFVVAGIGISYFWTAATIITLLLRQEIDGVPLDRLSLDDDFRPVREPLPVVGIPATDARDETKNETRG